MKTLFQLNQTEKAIPYVLFYDAEGSLVPSHWHKETELVYVLRGSARMVINDTLYELNKGDVAVVVSGDTHFYFQTHDHVRAVVMFAPELFEDGEEKRQIQKRLKGIARVSTQWSAEHAAQVRSIFEELIRLNDSERFGRNLSIRARIYDLTVLLGTEIEQDNTQKNTLEKNAQASMLANLEKAFLFVERNYSRPIDLEDAARELGFTPSYFARFFKRFTDVTFMAYLNEYRIGKVQQLLAQRNKNMTEIAEAAGFASIKTFNRVFKESTGLSPTQYQKSIFEEKQA